MWVILDTAAIITAILNLTRDFLGKDGACFRFASLSLTALTLCAFHSMLNRWVMAEDWSALMDTAGISKVLWVLTIVSILFNGISLFSKK